MTRRGGPALLTDLYELTMAASYYARGMNEPATFDLFVRELPERRNFLIAAGLEQALEYLENLSFERDEIDYLWSLGTFEEDFLAFLGDFKFGGEVWAMPEGEAAFEEEPLLRVTAPLIEAQIVETFLLNCIVFQTMVASKAARLTLACGRCKFVDFSLRRDHGMDAGMKAARASYIAGAAGTSNVRAGQLFGIPLSGTMAHSYVLAFASEAEAFEAFSRDFPETAVLLIDTFDVEQGARRAVDVARKLEPEGVRLKGVRIDSGDLAAHARAVRKILDDSEFHDVQIILSGDLDEYRIAQMVAEGVPAESFGVGTQLGTSGDAPSLGGVYKLVADHAGPKMKRSAGKATLPGRKQVWRVSSGGRFDHDVIALEDERVESARPLLNAVMTGGRRIAEPESLDDLRMRCKATLNALPAGLRSLTERVPYRVELSPGLRSLRHRMYG